MRNFQFLTLLAAPLLFWIGSTVALSMISKNTFEREQLQEFRDMVKEAHEHTGPKRLVAPKDKQEVEQEIKNIFKDRDIKGGLHIHWSHTMEKDALPEDADYTHKIVSIAGPVHLSLVDHEQWHFFALSNLAGLMMGLLGLFINILIILYTRLSSEKARLMEIAKNNAESELAQQSRFFETLITNLPGILFVKDARNGFRYHMLNPEAETFFGHGQEKMRGLTDYDLFNKEQADFFRATDERVMAGGKVVEIPCEIVTASFGDTLVHTRKVPIFDNDGNPQYLVGLSQDISERKRAELELSSYRSNLEHMVDERTEKLRLATIRAEEASRLKSEFLATMSHEIRSPMSGVIGMAELLLDTKLSQDQQGLARTIISSGEVLMNIIEDILDFSKIEANKLEIEHVPVNMLELVDDVCMLYSSQASEKALEIVVDYRAGCAYNVYADPHRMRQVLGNLINNAIKFTKKGHIVVGVHEEDDASDADTAILTFRVKDTGIGIEENYQDQVFEKFLQVNSSSTRTAGGTGLGLSICKKLVELMGGTVGLKSVYGEGSTFTVRLPMKRNKDDVTLRHAAPNLAGVRALIVDDLPVIQNLIGEYLSAAGAACRAVSSGRDALELLFSAKAKGEKFDIVFIDYLMPGMNGETLARAIYDEPEFRDLCLIMLSAAGNIAGRDLARKGFSAFIPKPIRSLTFADTVATIWGQYSNGHKDGLITMTPLSGAANDDDAIDDLSGFNILLVEDSRLNQVFVEEVLKPLSCALTIVSNGQEAVEILSFEKFDLVLMDCQMPVMDGFEAARRITAMKEDGRVCATMPILALTANAMKGDRQRCMEAGMNDYITKPVRKKELKEKIVSWLQKGHGGRSGETRESGPHDDLFDPAMYHEAKDILKDRFPAALECYFADTEEHLHTMQDCIERGDAQSLILPAHSIKSTSKRMGAARLSTLAAQVEYGVRESDPKDGRCFRFEVEEMVQVYQESRECLLRASR